MSLAGSATGSVSSVTQHEGQRPRLGPRHSSSAAPSSIFGPSLPAHSPEELRVPAPHGRQHARQGPGRTAGPARLFVVSDKGDRLGRLSGRTGVPRCGGFVGRLLGRQGQTARQGRVSRDPSRQGAAVVQRV